ncbi:MAG: alpha-amylase family glycosyl hydrolase [Paenisporosarcina sp.]
MNTIQRLSSVISMVLIFSFIGPLTIFAENNKEIMDESIYDLLVDRYFNKTIKNDFEVNANDPSKFAGGDFLGVKEKLTHIQKMGFTLVSLGPVFSTDTYDGKRVLDYTFFERHFGTEDEFKSLLKEAHDKKINVVVDFPIQRVSDQHVWRKDSSKSDWIIENGDGTIDWNLDNPKAQKALIESASEFVKTYNVDGLRLTAIEGVDALFLNEMIQSLKATKPDLYVLSNEESDAAFDLKVIDKQEDVYRNIFKNVDLPSNDFEKTLENSLVVRAVDTINDKRFTADAAEENMFPPTRWKMVLAMLMSVPGVPVMTYGSEIAMNGEKPPESNQIMNYKIEEELMDYIADLQLMRNGSDALRRGKIEMLHNDNGFMVYKRWNEEETWIVAINNTGKTQQFDLSDEVIGDNKELRGLFQSDILRQREDGSYRIVLDRELAEFFPVTEQKGFNKGYLAALALVYILFLGFLYLVWRKGKNKKQA